MNTIKETPVQFMDAFLSRKHNAELQNYFDDLAQGKIAVPPKDLTPTQKELEVQIFIKRFCPELH